MKIVLTWMFIFACLFFSVMLGEIEFVIWRFALEVFGLSILTTFLVGRIWSTP